jgi:hypothetical protein
MSLKAFHIAFVTLSSLLSLGFGAWAGQQYLESGETGLAVLALMSFIVGLGLIVYGRVFLRKLRNVSFL